MHRPIATLIAASCLALATPAAAGPIIQNQQTGTIQLSFLPAIGQSFTAEDAAVSIGFWVQEIRPDIAPAGDSLTITLREGEGAFGPVLGSVVVGGLASGHVGWVDADFSHLALSLGGLYTAIISDATPRWSLSFRTGSPVDDAYAGGRFVAGSALQPSQDARFRVLPVTPGEQAPPVTVSEPAGAGLIGLALVALVAARRRRGG